MDIQTLKKINWKQPKYMLPLIIYVPLLFVGYFVIDLFQTEKAEIPDSSMTTTEYLNPDLPDAKMKGDGIGNKYESMLSTAMRSVNCSNHRMPRNSLNYRDNYRKAHKKVRKSQTATPSQKKTD